MEKLFRQELKSYTPEWNTRCSIITDLILLIISLIIGILLIYYSKTNIEIKIEYTKCSKNFEYISSPNKKLCKILFKIEQKIPKNIYVYYKLENFYLNHRKLIESKNWRELRGEETNTKIGCRNAYYMNEMFEENSPHYQNEWGHTFNGTDRASPCGLLARSFFNDTFELMNENGTYITIEETGIASPYLKKKFFKRRKDYQNNQWIDVENEHFINWMNIETFNNFQKVWGKITTDLQPGKYYLIVNDNYDYNISEYGKKYFIISNTNVFGINNLAGYFFIGVAGYLSLIILILSLKYLLCKESKEVNISKLKWS